MRSLFLTLFVVCALGHQAEAKAYFQTKSEMIEKAEVIAIITIKDIQELKADDQRIDYQKSGQATVETRIKGEIPDTFKIYGNGTFICANCPITEGRFIAFLSKRGERWTGSNWHLSLRPITEDKVMWYVDDENRHDMKAADLQSVIAEIKAAIAANGNKSQIKSP